MAITYPSTATKEGYDSGYTLTLNRPAGGQAGDLYCIVLFITHLGQTLTYPPEFTKVEVSGDDWDRAVFLWAVEDASPAASDDITTSGLTGMSGLGFYLRGADTTDPVDVYAADAADEAEYTCPSVTPTADAGALICWISPGTNTPDSVPTSMTEIALEDDTSRDIWGAYEIIDPTSGATGGKAFTMSTSNNVGMKASIFIKAASGSASSALPLLNAYYS